MTLMRFRIIFFFLFTQILFAQKTSVVIDTDSANEVDDLFAILGALTEVKFDVVGITASQFHTSPYASKNTALESKIINDSILSLLDYKSIPSLIGSNQPIANIDSLTNSDASNFIIKKAKFFSKKNPLTVIVLGSCTNIATAILKDPAIINNIKVYYLGFWHNPITNSYDLKEFNTRNDPIAVDILLNSNDLDLTIMSATTSKDLIFNKSVVFSKLTKYNKLGIYFINRWESYKRWWKEVDQGNNKWTMWDVALVEAIANTDIATKSLFDTPMTKNNRKINIYTSINSKKMIEGYWKKIDFYFNSLNNE